MALNIPIPGKEIELPLKLGGKDGRAVIPDTSRVLTKKFVSTGYLLAFVSKEDPYYSYYTQELEDIARVLLFPDEIAVINWAIAWQIKSFYLSLDKEEKDKTELALIGIKRGATKEVEDLSRLLRIIGVPHEMGYMQYSRYGNGTESSSDPVRVNRNSIDITGKMTIVIEDIIDAGRTLKKAIDDCLNENPRSLYVCALLSKPSRREIDVQTDIVGVEVPDVFVVGQGMDYGEIYRQLPFIGVLKPHLYTH